MDFWNKINSGVLLFDGAMGTYYTEKYGHDPEYCELANLTHGGRVMEIYREYIEAGVDAIKTNTFGANPLSLECDFEKVMEIISEGWKLACSAVSGTDVAVFADIGPIPHAENESIASDYLPIAQCFLEEGAKNFLFETFSSTEGLYEVCSYIKEKCPESKIICSFAVAPDGFTREGVSFQRLSKIMEADNNVDAWGYNCVLGPNHIKKLIERTPSGTKPLIAMPNASYPTIVGNRIYFGNNSDYFAKCMLEVSDAGATFIGGCCGTTPEHIGKLRLLLDRRLGSNHVHSRPAVSTPPEIIENRLWNKLNSGKKIIAVELDPPANSDVRLFMKCARELKNAGADAITIADCPVSRARADSSLIACKLKRELDIDSIPHMTCRDRNIIATKALLMGLNMEGVNNVLAVTGDPVPTAERGIIKSVFNFNSVVLSAFVRDLGPELCHGPFRVFGALNLNSKNFDIQLRHAKDKEANGVSGFLTQPVHSPQALTNLKLARNELKGKILGGVMPIVSHRNACFMNSEIAGIEVCDEILRKYEGLDKESSSRLAISLSLDIARKMADYVDGYYLITPFMRTDLILEIMNALAFTK